VTISYNEADRAAVDAYKRTHVGGTGHALALNIAVSVWFCRYPSVDPRWARRRVSRLLDAIARPAAA